MRIKKFDDWSVIWEDNDSEILRGFSITHDGCLKTLDDYGYTFPIVDDNDFETFICLACETKAPKEIVEYLETIQKLKDV